MDQFGDPRVKEGIFMSSAQVGKTTIAENIIAYAVHRRPVPIMIVHKRADDSEKFSKERIANLVETSPVLRERFAKATSRTSGNTILHKRFRGGSLTMAQSNSPDSLRGRPIGLGIGDEVSSWEDTPQGDPVELFEARMIRFPNAQRFYFSTPGIHGKCKITEKFALSDKRHYFAPCPHCQEYGVYAYEPLQDVPTHVLKWEDGASIRTQTGKLTRTAKDAWFECFSCKGKINDAQRAESNRVAEWRATAPFNGRAGFWCWEANHPESTALSFANRWLAALGEPEKMKSVKNQVFGLAWKEAGQVLDWRRLYDRAETHYKLGTVPDGPKVLFGGIDVQHDRLELYVWGYGENLESWLIDFQVIEGDPAHTDVWQRLTNFVAAIQYPGPSGMMFPVIRWVIDSGFLASRVYEWATKYEVTRVRVVKGVQNGNSYAVRGSEIEVGHQVKAKTGHHIWLASKNLLLGQVYAWLKQDPPTTEKLAAGEGFPCGYIHTPPMQEEFFRQLTADMLIDGKWEDKKNYHRNEALDIRCYCDAEAYLSWVHLRAASGSELPLKAIPAASEQLPEQPAPVVRQQLPRPAYRVFGRRS